MSDETNDKPPEGFVENPNKPRRCIGCPLYDAPGPVWGSGPKENQKLMFVGEAPGDDEAGRTDGQMTGTGRPFTGGSGRFLTALCINTNIDRRTAYMTNAVKCRPKFQDPYTGTIKDRPPTKEEISWCAPFLAQELIDVHPNLVVALGASALYVFKDTDAIGKWRGQAFATKGGQKVLATYHPAALMRMQRLVPLVVEDLKKAKKEMETPTVSRLEVGYTVHSGGDDSSVIIAQARAAGFCVEDLETTGLDVWGNTNSILCWGAGTRAQFSDCYIWSPEVAETVRRLHSDPDIEMVGQFAENFDWPLMDEKGVCYPKYKRWDTLQAYHLVNPDLPADLGTQGSVYTDREYWKHKGRQAKSLQETMEYCCEDVDGQTRSYLTQKREIKYLGLEDLYYGSVMPVQPVLRRMTKRGMRKNEEKAAVWAVAMEQAADQKEETLRGGLGDPFFSVNSPQQVMNLLYNKLGLPVQYTRDKNRGMRPTANAEALDALAIIADSPEYEHVGAIFHLFNEIRTLRKWKATYCEVETDANGFMHPEFGTHKAANGRMNSWGPNAQNVPHDLRELWEADSEDHVLISADYSQVEWRNEMVLAADEFGLEMFRQGKDIHRTAATGFTGQRYEDVTKLERHAMKFVVYGLLYGRMAPSIAKQTGRTQYEVEQQILGFFKTFPGVQHHMRLIEDLVGKQQYLRNPFARRRWWYTRMITEALNFLPSSTGADMMYLVMPAIDRELPEGSTLRLTVHDELVANSLRDSKSIKQTTECIRDNMQRKFPQVCDASLRPEIAYKYYPDGYWAPVEITYGTNWKMCKPQTDDEEREQREFQRALGVAA